MAFAGHPDVSLDEERRLPALYMVFSPGAALKPRRDLAPGYELHIAGEQDRPGLAALVASDHWRIPEEQWQDYFERVLPDGLFTARVANTSELVGTASALHNPRGGRFYFPSGGAIGYFVVHPAHRRRGIGAVLISRAVERLLAAGYRNIWVGVQGHRLAAVQLYLEAGFVPFLHAPPLAERWQRIHAALGRPFTPDRWPAGL